jgi:hypothetical protein
VDAGYSGVRHAAEVNAVLAAGQQVLTLAWRVGRDVTRDPTLSWWDQGPRVALRFHAARAARLGLDAGLAWRRYDEIEPTVGTRRSDVVVDVAALAEVDVGDRWTVRATVALRREASTIPEFTYVKVVPMIGVGYTIGLF